MPGSLGCIELLGRAPCLKADILCRFPGTTEAYNVLMDAMDVDLLTSCMVLLFIITH